MNVWPDRFKKWKEEHCLRRANFIIFHKISGKYCERREKYSTPLCVCARVHDASIKFYIFSRAIYRNAFSVIFNTRHVTVKIEIFSSTNSLFLPFSNLHFFFTFDRYIHISTPHKRQQDIFSINKTNFFKQKKGYARVTFFPPRTIHSNFFVIEEGGGLFFFLRINSHAHPSLLSHLVLFSRHNARKINARVYLGPRSSAIYISSNSRWWSAVKRATKLPPLLVFPPPPALQWRQTTLQLLLRLRDCFSEKSILYLETLGALS